MPLIEPFVPKRQFEVLRSHSSKSQWLFFVTPLATAILLVVEAIQYRKGTRGETATGSFFMPGLAIFLFLEALALDLYILSQLRMH